jgi:DNA-binding transcriptional MerR regulator
MTNPITLIGTRELAHLCRVSERQIMTWADLRYLRESPRQPGTGHRRAFSPSEARVAQIMAVMVNAGVSPAMAAPAARRAILEADDKGPVFMTELAHGIAVTGRIHS